MTCARVTNMKHFEKPAPFYFRLSEDSLTGYGIGLALNGFKPIHVHQRTDFLLLCCNQLINIAAKVKYLSNGSLTCPFVARAITGRSWGQGSQHSQSFHSLFANIPGFAINNRKILKNVRTLNLRFKIRVYSFSLDRELNL